MTCLAVCAAMRPNSIDSIFLQGRHRPWRQRHSPASCRSLAGVPDRQSSLDYRPATEGLVATVLPIDLTRRSTSSSKRFCSSGQSQLQCFEDHTSRYTFSLDTDSTTSSTLLIVRLAFRNPLGPRDPRLTQNGELCWSCRSCRSAQILVIINQHHYILLLDPPEKTLKIAPTSKGERSFILTCSPTCARTVQA